MNQQLLRAINLAAALFYTVVFIAAGLITSANEIFIHPIFILAIIIPTAVNWINYFNTKL